MMSRRPRSRFLSGAFSLLSALLLLLSACSATGTPISQTGGKPVKGGTWIDDIPKERGSLIPNGDSQTFSVLVEQSLYAPLFVGDANGKIKPGIVSEMPTTTNGDISSDLKTWTFKLKPNLKWSDGMPLNADDVNFTWKLWDNPKFGAATTAGYNLIKSADVSADKLSITFHLSQPYSPFLAVWTYAGAAPIPMHHFASMSPDAILKSNDN